MKKPASPANAEKNAKRTPEEKAARKSAKKAGRAADDLTDDRASKKASQKKTLKSAAKQLQKELNNRMNEVVIRIRKETKAKLKEVVKEATRRLDVDTERMFEEALHTIVRHYDSVASSPAAANGHSEISTAPTAGKAPRTNQKGQTLNKDGTPRKTRASREDAANGSTATLAPSSQGRKPGTAAAGAKRGPKPAAVSNTTGAKRGPKPRAQSAPQPESGALNAVASASNGEANT